MKIGSLFAGIGGFDLAAESLGWSTAWVSEIDPDASFWLAQHFPDAPHLGDVTQIDWSTVEPVDVLCGGFPCQPHSVAGKREASDDSRDLWSECVRAVGDLRPRYAVFENVPGLLTSESGGFFNRVISDLAALGYVGSHDVLSAAECGAPHRRERVWIVCWLADAEHEGRREGQRRAGGDGADSQRHDEDDRPAATELRGELGHATGGGRRAGQGEPVRRLERGRDGVGDPGGAGREERESPGVAGHAGHAGHATGERRCVGIRNPWSDAIPYRGADGTVRLIPAGAFGGNVAHADHGERSSADDVRQREGRTGTVGSGATDGQRENEEISRPEPALRALVDGIPDGLARRPAAEEGAEVKGWHTPKATDAEYRGDFDATDPRTGISGQSRMFAGAGGSLWPVTESEPGRVARLKAVGNAVVPAWVLAGPFAFIQARERGEVP